MIYLKEVENLTLKNGTIEGDRYDHDYSTYNENSTSHEFNVGIKIDQGSRNINIDNVKFRQKVVPGDTLLFKVELLHPVRHGISSMKGYMFVGDRVVSEATFTAQIVKNK